MWKGDCKCATYRASKRHYATEIVMTELYICKYVP